MKTLAADWTSCPLMRRSLQTLRRLGKDGDADGSSGRVWYDLKSLTYRHTPAAGFRMAVSHRRTSLRLATVTG